MRAQPLALFDPVVVGKRNTLCYVVVMYDNGFKVREGKIGQNGKLRGPYRYKDKGKMWRRVHGGKS